MPQVAGSRLWHRLDRSPSQMARLSMQPLKMRVNLTPQPRLPKSKGLGHTSTRLRPSVLLALAPPLVKNYLGQRPPASTSQACSLRAVPDRDERRGLDGFGDAQQRLDLVFVLRMQRGQHGAEPERAGGQQQILDGRIDRSAPRDRSWSCPRGAVIDAGEDEHGHGGHL